MLNALQTLIATAEAMGLESDEFQVPAGFDVTSRPGRDVIVLDVATFRDALHWALHNQRDARELLRKIDELPGPVEIVKIVQTCFACPSQWDGWDAQGNYYYFRYRNAHLRVSTWPEGVCISDRAKEIYSQCHGEGEDGVMAYEELRRILQELLILPEYCEQADA